jgi:hypothetical protein
VNFITKLSIRQLFLRTQKTEIKEQVKATKQSEGVGLGKAYVNRAAIANLGQHFTDQNLFVILVEFIQHLSNELISVKV